MKMGEFGHTLKSNIWLFFLFLLPSYIIVTLTNDFFYTYTMNSPELFKLASYISIFVVDILLLGLHSYIESTMPTMSIRNAVKKITVVTAFIFSIVAIITMALSGFFVYESCGKEFNERFISSSEIKNVSFCFDRSVDLSTAENMKKEVYCKTPNKDKLLISSRIDNIGVDKNVSEKIMYERYVSSCISSMADYSGEISLCDSLKIPKYNITYNGSMKDYEFTKCISNFAINRKDWKLCEPIRDSTYVGKQVEWEKCIKSVSEKIGDESLCEMIPASSGIRDSCFFN